ncbi:MAG: DUF4442 domain-containing protein [Chitinophagales bacterium]|nr:DUF4442 domain-containing protein [Chitinophagales bacterium]MCZ2393148.1 DUF4442 domain-containing protein [Chitinophagales bacterium]
MNWLKISKKRKAKLINFYPPFLGANIQLEECNENLTQFQVKLSLNRWNKNVMGTHFGGSLYAMCDPFYMWILMENLGKDFIVWDKAATIQFKKPGTGTVRAIFEISIEQIENIRKEVIELGKNDYHFSTVVKNENGQIVAEVDKTVYVRYNKKRNI